MQRTVQCVLLCKLCFKVLALCVNCTLIVDFNEFTVRLGAQLDAISDIYGDVNNEMNYETNS